MNLSILIFRPDTLNISVICHYLFASNTQLMMTFFSSYDAVIEAVYDTSAYSVKI